MVKVRNVAFTRHEAVLLLDAYLKVLYGELTRTDSVKDCSRMLRLMAINSGVEIDDTYRNVSGISLQMASMESAYQERTIVKPASRLFTEIANLFKNNNMEYQRLLTEAKDLAETKQNNEEAFLSWLSKKVSATQLSELYMALTEINEHVKKEKLVIGSLYDHLDSATVKRVKSSIEQRIIFKLTHKWLWNRILSALNYLLQYANNKFLEVDAIKHVQKEVYPKPVVESVATPTLAETTEEFGDTVEKRQFSAPDDDDNETVTELCRQILNVISDRKDNDKEKTIDANKEAEVDSIKQDQKEVYPKPVAEPVAEPILAEVTEEFNDIVERKPISDLDNDSKDTPKSDQPLCHYFREDKEKFYRWLKEKQLLAEKSCSSYVSAIRSAECFATEYGLTSNRLYTNSIEEARATADALFANSKFVELNNNQHNRYSAAISKLLAFYGSNWKITGKHEVICPQKKKAALDMTPYVSILADHFPKGYRLESTLDMKRMRRYYEELTGKVLDLDQTKLEATIREYGIVYNGRLYMPQNMLSDEMKERILAFIDRCFEDGASAVYYEAIFKEFSEDLLDFNIADANMLKAFLEFSVADKYCIGRSYLSLEYHTAVDPVDEVRQCLKQYATPVQINDICATLPHIPEDRVCSILGSNGEFVRNSKGEYFHADSLDLTEEELKNIIVIIDSAINEHKFISGNELYDAIRIKYPHTFDKNASFSTIGWRDALKYKIGNKFFFVGNIISKSGISMSDVFAEYGKSKSLFSIEELIQFADSIGTDIYFGPLYTNVIRISQQWFASKSNAHFSVKETDAVLERFCSGKYMPLCAIQGFAVFPEASFPWTEYLLEQYVAFFSEKFYLLHGDYSKNCTVGAIVKKNSGFNTFDDLVTDIIACSGVPLQKKEVLDYLAENGYIARRAYTNIETLIINARAIKNQKEK